MMLDWDGYRQELLKRIGDLGRLSPATVRGYRKLSDAGANRTSRRQDAGADRLAVGVTRERTAVRSAASRAMNSAVILPANRISLWPQPQRPQHVRRIFSRDPRAIGGHPAGAKPRRPRT